MKGTLLAAWRYRGLVASMIRGEFRARFGRSSLGGLWALIHPIVQAAIYALVLAGLMASKLPGMANDRYAYAIYLLSGILGWTLFTEVINRCLNLFIENGNLMKKISFPRICLPVTVVGSALINNGLLFVAILAVFLLLGHVPGVHILWMPLLFALTLMLAVGLGLLLGVINVFIRDVGQLVPVLLQLGFWMTPIVYPANAIPARLNNIVQLNPMSPIVQGMHDAMLFNKAPDIAALASVGVLSLVLLGLALLAFRRAGPEMVDVL